MDPKAFNEALARNLDIEPKAAAQLVAALAQTLKERASNLDSVAIPGFGNFVAIKQREQVVEDASGRRTLLPPQLKIEFVASAMLKKQIANE